MPSGVGHQIRAVLIRLGSSTEFYIGFDSNSPDSAAGGVYRSLNGGQTWNNYNGGALNNEMTVRGLWSRDTAIYAGVSSGVPGVYSNQETPVIISTNNENIPGKFALFQNFPNPFNPASYIGYNLPKESYVVLKVYDAAGREVRTIVEETKPAGSYQVTFDGSSFTSGIYLYQIICGDFRETRKMILVK